MTKTEDPFARHPELRGRIADADGSFFRTFTVASLLERFPELEVHRDWAYDDGKREATRARTLAGHAGDLWVFAYGSLMWDPALRFAEVRRARVSGLARHLSLLDVRGGRGTAEAPGLMAALDLGESCEGLAFRIAAEAVDAETEILWRREMVGPGYIPRFISVDLDDGVVQALAFLADRTVPEIRPDLTREQQVRFVAHGAGFLGTSREYLANIVSHFAALEIHDDACVSLLREVDDHLASLNRDAEATR